MKKIMASTLAVAALSLICTAFMAPQAQAFGFKGKAPMACKKNNGKRMSHRHHHHRLHR